MAQQQKQEAEQSYLNHTQKAGTTNRKSGEAVNL